MIVQARQHLYSSVERGYFTRHGQGFQTVAVDEELAGGSGADGSAPASASADLAVLEDVSFYAVSRERRARAEGSRPEELPIKETFLRLPSGRFALGRTVAWGADALGREGNSLTHHLIVSQEELESVGTNPFLLLDAAPPLAPGLDLTPRVLPPLSLTVARTRGGAPDLAALAGLSPATRAALGAALLDRGDRSLLLVGDERRSRGAIRALFSLLPREERLKLTFCSHFYESEHLRAHFAVVTVSSPAEAPSHSAEYVALSIDDEPRAPALSQSAYAGWLATRLQSGEWEEIRAVSAVLDQLRGGECPPGVPALPGGSSAAALWEQIGTPLARALVGQPERIADYLTQLPDRRGLADALLAEASPSHLCGAALPGSPDGDGSSPASTPEQQESCLLALRAAASPRAWQVWAREWAADPALPRPAIDARPWWRRWRR